MKQINYWLTIPFTTLLVLPFIALATTDVTYTRNIGILLATSTAYSSVETCVNTDCIMANGKKAHIGAVACPRVIKLGTQVRINGLTYICSDRTAKRYDGRFDIFWGFGYEAYRQALVYGIKQIQVEIL